MKRLSVYDMIHQVIDDSRAQLAKHAQAEGSAEEAAETKEHEDKETGTEEEGEHSVPAKTESEKKEAAAYFSKLADACEYLAQNLHQVNDDRTSAEKLAEYAAVHEYLMKHAEDIPVNPPLDSGAEHGGPESAMQATPAMTEGENIDAGEGGQATPANQPPAVTAPVENPQPADANNAMPTNEGMMMPPQPEQLLVQEGGTKTSAWRKIAGEGDAREGNLPPAGPFREYEHEEVPEPADEQTAAESDKKVEAAAFKLAQSGVAPRKLAAAILKQAADPTMAARLIESLVANPRATGAALGGAAGMVGGGAAGLAGGGDLGSAARGAVAGGIGGAGLGALGGHGLRHVAQTPELLAKAGPWAGERMQAMSKAIEAAKAKVAPAAKTAAAKTKRASKVKRAEDAIYPARIEAGTTPALQQVPGIPSQLSQGSEAGELTPRETAPNVGEGSGRELIESNDSAIRATKGNAKAQNRSALAELLNEPALSSATDRTLHEVFDRTPEAGVKLAATKMLLKKLARMDPRMRVKIAALVKKAQGEEEGIAPQYTPEEAQALMGGTPSPQTMMLANAIQENPELAAMLGGGAPPAGAQEGMEQNAQFDSGFGAGSTMGGGGAPSMGM